MLSTTAPDYFAKDLAKLNAALEPHLRILEDGLTWIHPDAPESLTRPYRDLVCMGYANGWIG